jgi:two-component system chemotaxis response regulator CheB
MPARVLVVDDSAFMRKVISEMVASDPALEVAGTARDGADALSKVAHLRPDLMTLDVEMPVLNGLDTLRKLRDLPLARKPRVVMCSSLTREGSVAALQALDLGAADFVAKDSSIAVTGLDELRKDLVEKLKALAPRGSAGPRPAPPPRPVPASLVMPARAAILAIGSSTGGPPVLERLLTRLPRDLPCPVVVAQHMPALFTRSLSERLNSLGPLPVTHAEEGDRPLEGGRVYVIQGALNGHVSRGASGRLVLKVSREPVGAVYKPSVNVLLETAGRACGKGAVAVVLTGMGDDGLQGGRVLAAEGGLILSQDEASSVVYGMPRAVAEAGLSVALTPEEITRALEGLSPSLGVKRAG